MLSPQQINEFRQTGHVTVTRCGVSFHHGNTPHQSSANQSGRPRRAAAIHYPRSDARLVKPDLSYDEQLIVAVT